MAWGTADGSGLNHDRKGKGAACRFGCCGVGDLLLIHAAIALAWEGVCLAARMELFSLSRIGLSLAWIWLRPSRLRGFPYYVSYSVMTLSWLDLEAAAIAVFQTPVHSINQAVGECLSHEQ